MKSIISKLVPQSLKNSYHWLEAQAAVLYFKHPAKKLTVIGVTGTDGKTTTSTIIYHLLKEAGYKVALISTVGAYVGSESLDTGFHVTSPAPWQLQKIIKKITEQGFEYLVLEATSHGLDQHRLLGTDINIGVLTNITHEHLDYHKTYDNYVTAKAKLFKNVKLAVINKDDLSYKKVKPLVNPNATIIAYSNKTLSFKRAKIVETVFPQPYNQMNATAALQVLDYLGASEKLVNQALKSFPGIPGRMEMIKNKRGITALVDFAHTPNGLEQALKSLRKQTHNRIIAVYGSAGLRDYEKRPLMGKIGSELADEVVLTAEDPRIEDVWDIITAMKSSITQNLGHIHAIPDRKEAITFAVSLAQKGDIVAVFGKGHEKSMCFGTIEYPWSDQEVLRTILT